MVCGTKKTKETEKEARGGTLGIRKQGRGAEEKIPYRGKYLKIGIVFFVNQLPRISFSHPAFPFSSAKKPLFFSPSKNRVCFARFLHRSTFCFSIVCNPQPWNILKHTL